MPDCSGRGEGADLAKRLSDRVSRGGSAAWLAPLLAHQEDEIVIEAPKALSH